MRMGGTYLAATEPSLIRQLNLASGTDRPKIRSAPTRIPHPMGNIESGDVDSGLSDVGLPARRLTLPDHSSPSVIEPLASALELGSPSFGNLAVKV